jgi:hypothetical protein
MENAHDSWPAAALVWLAAPSQDRFPAALSDAIANAHSVEIEDFLGLLLANLDQLPLRPAAAFDSPSEEYALEEEETSEPAAASQRSRRADEPVTTERGQAGSRVLERLRVLLQLAAARGLRLRLESEGELAPAIDPDLVADLATQLVDDSPLAAAHCLQILAAQGDHQSLSVLCGLIQRQILDDEQSVAVALSPLFQWPPPGLASVFEMVGEDIWRWQLLGPMLDLAGHSLRKGKLRTHPLADQRARLRELLGSTAERLARLEENPQQFGDDVATIQRVLNNAVALTVSLCDALGLIGDAEAEGKLARAMALSHRRVQTEAAGALARLGKPEGKRRLLELAQDPAARLRALAYADELGLDDPQLNDLRTPLATAEAEVVAWLADRERFGVPPAELELIDQRTQYWPSYEEPQNCSLWRFTYHFAKGDLSNIVIAGPLVTAFQADLRSLEIDDMYALFAGWQAEHEEIYEVPSVQCNAAQRAETERLLRDLAGQGIENLQPLALTFFFGERAVLATGWRAGQKVCAVSDGSESLVQPIDDRPTSLTPDLVLAIYRGNKLLRTFN